MQRHRLIPAVISVLMAFGCSSSNTPTAPSATSGISGTSVDPATPLSGAATQAARYRITFDATWTSSTHPIDFPSGAHFSALIGATHTSSVSFWREGGLATRGIQDMAERGRTSPLDQEIENAIQAGTAERVWIGGGIGASPGSTSLEFEMSQRYPLVTFVSMIAPSPDWFVGISGVSLLQDGQWVGERRIDLVPWDAGTDSGTTFTSADRDTQPRVGIARILSAPLAPGGSAMPLGTFTITRLPNAPITGVIRKGHVATAVTAHLDAANRLESFESDNYRVLTARARSRS